MPTLPKSLQTLLDKFRAAIRALTSSFEDGDIDGGLWYATMRRLITRYLTAGYMAGQGSPYIGVDEQGQVYEYVKAQFGFLDNFYLTIQSMTEFMPGWTVRAESYANGIVAPYWKGNTKVLPLPAMPGDMTTPCGQLCACLWDVQVIDETANDYDCYWRLNASRIIETEHCQGCEQRAVEWNPIQVRDGRLIVPQGVAGKELEAHLLVALKHLAGQHDQKRHGRRVSTSEGEYTVNHVDATDARSFNKHKLENDAQHITVDLFNYAYEEAIVESGECYVLRDDTGAAQAFYSGEIGSSDLYDFPKKSDKVYYLKNAGTHPRNLAGGGKRGWGVKAMYEAIRDALDGGADYLFLTSASDQSDKFYNKMSMTSLGGGKFYYDRKQMRELLKLYERYY